MQELDDDVAEQLSAFDELAVPLVVAKPKLAQAFRCGAWSLAVDFDWARTIVEQFELVEIPKSPAWLLGACNVEGLIIPVVDLSMYLAPESAAFTDIRKLRLLIGGTDSGNSENALGLVFSGLPQQIRYVPELLTPRSTWPSRLVEICSASAKDASGETYLEIDAFKLTDALSGELSVV
jgi:chemotaxis signal transduction protein